MDDTWQHLFIAILALLVMCLAAIVQSTVGMTSSVRLRRIGDGDGARTRSVQSLVDPRRVLAASMVLLQVLTAILATGELMAAFGDGFGWLAMLIVAMAFAVFGLALPRALASKPYDALTDRLLKLGVISTYLLAPLNWLVEHVADVFARIIPGEAIEPESYGLEEELRPSRNDRDDDVIGPDERVMIDGILSLEEMTVRDIMVPRLDIVAVDRSVDNKELVKLIVEAGHSRIPVYQGSIDRIIGVLYAKDLLPFVIGDTDKLRLLDLIRPAFVVPESKRLNELFSELRRTRIHLAIVADEYGGTAGLVTIEDILEEIVGEIQDEYDAEDWMFDRLSDDQILADGRLPIEDVEDALGLQFEEDDDFGTLGGFVHKHLGRLPIKGDSFEAEGVKVDILAVERHRIRRLRLTRLAPPESDPEAPSERGSRWRRSEQPEPEAESGPVDGDDAS